MKLVIIILIVLLIWVLGVFAFRQGWWDDIVPNQSEELTEVFFTDHIQLPKVVSPVEQDVSITLVNRTNGPEQYSVSLGLDGKVHSNLTIRLGPDEKGSLPFVYIVPSDLIESGERVQVQIFVNEEPRLHYWLEPVEITDVEVQNG